jgi:hypothetical protein
LPALNVLQLCIGMRFLPLGGLVLLYGVCLRFLLDGRTRVTGTDGGVPFGVLQRDRLLLLVVRHASTVGLVAFAFCHFADCLLVVDGGGLCYAALVLETGEKKKTWYRAVPVCQTCRSISSLSLWCYSFFILPFSLYRPSLSIFGVHLPVWS